MSVGQTVLYVLRKTGLVLGALLLVTVLLSAMPCHHAPAVRLTGEAQDPQPSPAPSRDMRGMDHASMPGMDMDDAKVNEQTAVSDMTGGHHDAHDVHMTMTSMRPRNGQDVERAQEIAAHLREGIEKYKDYHAALNDGYKIFLPNLPQPEYHFTNYWKGFLEAFSFDPSRPTSLLYKKTSTGYELVGAMYTMPKHATEEQLNERVPLSVAMWHLHTNLCMPPKKEFRASDWTKFGLKGSIATLDACNAAGGRFQPSIFGWMVHVYPYQDSLDKIYPIHHMD
ncbi:MAG: hypothetical protein NVS9B13_23890 [Candidatus Acidiferrum sp.]